MSLTSLYKDYFQKSKIFLYPILDIKRGGVLVPIETYVGYNEELSSEDMKLICLYEIPDEQEKKNFEKYTLLRHSRLWKVIDLSETKKLYIFDFSDLKDDWDLFLQGKYSKLSKTTKEFVKNYFEKNSANQNYIESFLYPEKYFGIYADLLSTDVSLLQEVGELCNKPDLQKECIKVKVKQQNKVK